MNERVNRYLELLKKDIEKKQDLLDQVEENPLLFLSDLVRNREGLIPLVLGERGEAELLAYQNWLYPKVISALVEKFNITDYTLHFNEKVFPSPIILSQEDAAVAEIRPYEHAYVIKSSKRIPALIEEMLGLLPEMLRLEEEIQRREVESENPLLLGGANPVKLLKIGVSKKKTIASIKEQAVVQFESLSALQQQYRQLEEELEWESDRMFFQEDLSRIGKRLQEHYDFIALDERIQSMGSLENRKAAVVAAYQAEKEQRWAPDDE